MKKQPNSRRCFVCGASNSAGLNVRFYECDDHSILAFFTPCEHHADDDGNLHTGAISAVMDEAMGRAIMIPYADKIWGVTAELSFKFLRPAPVGVELRVTGRITEEKSRVFEGTGELRLADGTVAAEAHAKYRKLDMDQIGDFDPQREKWAVRAE